MPCLSDADRTTILDLARQAIAEAVCHGRLKHPIPNSDVLERRCGVFVSLHVQGKLRGCIGVIDGRAPLGESIVRCAAGAALEDPRFPRMKPEEVGAAEVEVSLMTALEPMRPEEIEIGTHGLMVEQGGRRGLLLPQVAVEHHLERERFLEETCWKAGLTREAWKNPDTKIYGFRCEIVSEKK
ncbi:MAG TPA: AmmeMemoRadiSam system protein A [Verrucomicrobiae bacterium]|nr:AmmeMemoRadiSam system protein A [Verrucomicrobiae bacterium]